MTEAILNSEARKLRIAVVGCLHGELDIIYERIDEAEKKENFIVDLLLVCGDFQAIRNENDLKCMAVPDKYKQLGTFYKYYFGEKLAPKLTILIGGNHEASNYLQTLPYGGWVAPNMYYLGYCSVVQFAGIRIGGISGIYKKHHAPMSHFERLPYNNDTMRSIYHMRETEVYKLMQLSSKRNAQKQQTNANVNAQQNSDQLRPIVDIFLSHDWPLNIHNCGNVGELLKKKPYFKQDIFEKGGLGNRLLSYLVPHLKPKNWFAAHLHINFSATVNHRNTDSNSETQTSFQALDKVKQQFKFLHIFDINVDSDQKDQEKKLYYDPEWLAILKKTDHLLKVQYGQVGINLNNAYNNVQISEEDINEIVTLLQNNLIIPENFAKCEPVVGNTKNEDNDPKRWSNYTNPQTTRLCNLFSLRDPNQLFVDVERHQCGPTQTATANPDAIDLSDDEDDCCFATQPKQPKVDNDLFFIDTKGTK